MHKQLPTSFSRSWRPARWGSPGTSPGTWQWFTVGHPVLTAFTLLLCRGYSYWKTHPGHTATAAKLSALT